MTSKLRSLLVLILASVLLFHHGHHTCHGYHVPRTIEAAHASDLQSRASDDSPQTPSGLVRRVQLVIEINQAQYLIDPQYGIPRMRTHAFLEFSRTDFDGAFRVQIASEIQDDSTIRSVVHAYNWGLHSLETVRSESLNTRADTTREYFEILEETTVTNDMLINRMTGRGLVLDVLEEDSTIRLGGGDRKRYTGALTFAERLLRHTIIPNFTLSETATSLLLSGARFAQLNGKRSKPQVVKMIYDDAYAGGADTQPGIARTTFDVRQPRRPAIVPSSAETEKSLPNFLIFMELPKDAFMSRDPKDPKWKFASVSMGAGVRQADVVPLSTPLQVAPQ